MIPAFRHLSPVAPDKLARVLQGFCIAFDTRDATVVEVDPTNRHVERVADTFTGFIHAYQQEPG